MKQNKDPDSSFLNERLRRSLDGMIDPYVLLKPVRDEAGKIFDFIFEYANEAVGKLLTIARDSILGKSITELFPVHKSSGLLDKYIEVAETGNILRIDSYRYDGVYIDRPFGGVFDILATKLNGDIAVAWHDVTGYNEAIAKLTRQKVRLDIVTELTEKLAECAFDYPSILNIITERASTLIGDACIVGLITADYLTVECESLYHKNPDAKTLLSEVISSYDHKTDESVIGEAIMSGSTVFLPFIDAKQIEAVVPEAYRQYIRKYGIFSLLIVPLKVRGKVIGVIVLFRDSTQEPYANEDILLFEDIALKASLYIYNGRLYRNEQNEIEERIKAQEDLKNVQKKLEDTNRELQQFAYVASHDLKEPLRMIAGFLDLLARRYSGKLDEKAEEFIHYAVDGAKRLEKMINDILEYSRIVTRGKDFEEVDSGEVMESVINNLSKLITDNNASVTYEKMPVIKADRTQLARIFQNLISNAIKFNRSSAPVINIKSRQTEDGWVFSVEDNGIGISQEQYENIFMLFRRLYPEYYPGTGAGLPIAKRIIDRHGGRIWVESEEGKGSTFHFTIPENPEK
ncbi:MAG: ATP-binding protein [Bacillota bacterium]